MIAKKNLYQTIAEQLKQLWALNFRMVQATLRSDVELKLPKKRVLGVFVAKLDIHEG